MGKQERKIMVACMEFIARNLNDENIFDSWLMCGVADGDISHGNLVHDFTSAALSVGDYYIESDEFSYLMGLFLKLMKRAEKSGGLYCDNIVSENL